MPFTINWVKVGIGAAIVVASVTAVYLGYRHYNGLVEAKAALSSQVATLTADVAREKARADAFELTINKWDEAAREQAKSLDQFTQAQREASQYQRELKDVLSKHDLGALAKRKPGLIENRVNAGTDRALRLLESASEGTGPGAAQAAPAGRPAGAAAR